MMLNTQRTLSFGYAYGNSSRQQLTTLSQGSHEVIIKIKLAQKKLTVVPENDQFERDESKIGSKF